MTVADAVVAAHRTALTGVSDVTVVDVLGDNGDLTPGTTRWVSVFPDEGTLDQGKLCAPGDMVTVRWLTNSVGPTRTAAGWLAGKVRDYLTRTWLSIPGWSSAMAEHDLSVQARYDSDVPGDPVVICSDRYLLTVTRESP